MLVVELLFKETCILITTYGQVKITFEGHRIERFTEETQHSPHFACLYIILTKTHLNNITVRKAI